MNLRPFPADTHIVWNRLDQPGREKAHIERTATGWRLTGDITIADASLAEHLRYAIEADPAWRTHCAVVEGQADGAPVRFVLLADGQGHWTSKGSPVPELTGTLDVDLGFTPATNMLSIRRLDLEVGQSAASRAAWIRFPELRLETLDQTYTREAEQSFLYRAMVDGQPFAARLQTDPFGRILHYEGLWQAEPEVLEHGKFGAADWR